MRMAEEDPKLLASCILSLIVSERRLAMRMAEDPRLPASCIISLILHQPSLICPRPN